MIIAIDVNIPIHRHIAHPCLTSNLQEEFRLFAFRREPESIFERCEACQEKGGRAFRTQVTINSDLLISLWHKSSARTRSHLERYIGCLAY